MKLREKSIAVIITAYFITFILLFLVCGTIIMNSFKNLENSDVIKNVNRIQSAIDYDINSLSLKSKDYASWDSTYEFMETKNQEYIKSEMVNDTFSNLQLNFLAIMDNKLNSIFTKGFDIENSEEVPLSSGEREFLAEIKNNNLTKNIDEKNDIHGLILMDDKPMLISIRSILTSESKGPSKGYLITGRFLDNKEIANIEKIINEDFTILLVKNISGSLPENLNKKRLDLQNNNIVVNALSINSVAGYVLNKDIYGGSTFIIKVPMERIIMFQGRTSMQYLVISLFTIGFVFLIVTTILLDRLVLKRMLKLNAKVNEIGYKEDFSMRVEVSGKDEISSLSESVNSMLMTLEASFNKLKFTNEKLQELDELKNEFISTVSHELRTPLTSILGFANLIKRKFIKTIIPAITTEDEKVSRASKQIIGNAEIIISEGERLTQIINDVLDLSKIEAGKVDWKVEDLSIGDVIDKALTTTETIIKQKELKLIKEIDKDLPFIKGDKDKLMQVVINLISNAVKFTEKGSITCRASFNHREIIVSIIDTGIGIDEKNKKVIFEKFKQLEDNRENKPMGTGLGLPICKSIIEHYNGKIWVEKNLNKGSKFSFSLPIRK